MTIVSPPTKNAALPFFTNLFFPKHGFTANLTMTTSNNNSFRASNNIENSSLRTKRRASADSGLAKVVIQCFV
jgi:hypothetical protein